MPGPGGPESKLAPSTAPVGVATKLGEGLRLFADHVGRARDRPDFTWLFRDIEQYDRLLRRHAGIPLQDARVFEVGYGTRPYRLTALSAMGVDASGVDAEAPVLDGSWREYRATYAANGLERTLKSALRHLAFDRSERAALEHALRARGHRPGLDRARLLVANAATVDVDPGSYDLVFSEVAFEHVDMPSLKRLVPALARWLRPGGLALIRPNVFTGITGGHVIEWNHRSFERPRPRRRSEPWEHLRKRRFRANTQLNELTRADYRSLFAPQFEILDEIVSRPDLGRELLTAEVAADLARWSDDELFSNEVLFVLRPLERLSERSSGGFTPPLARFT